MIDMDVNVHWEVEFYRIDGNETKKGSDLVSVTKEEFDSIFDVADIWLDDCIDEKIARGCGYSDNEMKLPMFFSAIDNENDIQGFKIVKVEEL